jgi:hypothetical protein
LEFLDELI